MYRSIKNKIGRMYCKPLETFRRISNIKTGFLGSALTKLFKFRFFVVVY